ncbi:hypothetical protein VIBNIFTn2_120092 [Vibrio nigripulchritudo FTn2]|nr:hypothetical protein VIBNIFTn2_120092 [Vibrio nigripulchritudo FTn2]
MSFSPHDEVRTSYIACTNLSGFIARVPFTNNGVSLIREISFQQCACRDDFMF